MFEIFKEFFKKSTLLEVHAMDWKRIRVKQKIFRKARLQILARVMVT